MKLQRVVLPAPIRIGNMVEADREVTDKECPELRYDEKLQVIDFGNGVMRREWVEMEKDNEALLCPECEQEYSNASALGSHRRHKHGVKGAA